MTYKNTKTGFVFDSPCEIKGEDWVALNSSPVSKEENEEKEVKPVRSKRTKKDE